MLKRRRRYRCPACKRILLRVASTKTVKSYCTATGQDVRMRLWTKRAPKKTAVDLEKESKAFLERQLAKIP